MQKPVEQKVPELQDINSRDGVRGMVRELHKFLTNFLRADNDFKHRAYVELNPLYGEADYTPAAILAGAESTIVVTVPGAILGYTVEASYDESLQGLQMTASVDAADTVNILLSNVSGSTVTLSAGRFRAYAHGRPLTS